jgi:hypothetical protein
MSLVVATALGPQDHDAREVAGLLARRLHVPLTVVHVREPHEDSETFIRGLLENATHELSRFGIAVDNTLLRGDPVKALTDYVRGVKPRLVVIGGATRRDTRGRGERRKARHLVDTLGVPVLCVPHAGPMMQALMSGKPLHVLVRAEHDGEVDAALMRAARAIRTVAPSQVTVLCASHAAPGRTDDALSVAAHGRFDVVVLDACLLESMTSWPFDPDAKPMLFVSTASGRSERPAYRTAVG